MHQLDLFSAAMMQPQGRDAWATANDRAPSRDDHPDDRLTREHDSYDHDVED